jgi:hypothetical protein
VDGRSGNSYAEDERPVGARPYLDRSVGNAPPPSIPRPHNPRHAPHHGNVYQFPTQPGSQRSGGTSGLIDQTVVGNPPARRASMEDLEATDTMELSRSRLTPRDTRERTAGPPRRPGRLDGARRPGGHVRRRAVREPSGIGRRRRLALQAAYVIAFGLCSYLLLGGLGLVTLPFDPASLIPGSDSSGSDQPITPPGPADTGIEPSVGSFTQHPEPVGTPTMNASVASSPVPTPTSSALSTPTGSPTPPAAASPTPTKKHPTPPGQTRKPTKPPPSH